MNTLCMKVCVAACLCYCAWLHALLSGAGLPLCFRLVASLLHFKQDEIKHDVVRDLREKVETAIPTWHMRRVSPATIDISRADMD